MCGIFGAVGVSPVRASDLYRLAKLSRRRGQDSSGIVFWSGEDYVVKSADLEIVGLLASERVRNSTVFAGHSRLITNGFLDNQPVVRSGIALLHNGIILNSTRIWHDLEEAPELEIDSEVLAPLARRLIDEGCPVDELGTEILARCKGVVNCAMLVPDVGALLLFSNNGSLHIGEKNGIKIFSSEAFTLQKIGCRMISQVTSSVRLEIPKSTSVSHRLSNLKRTNLIPTLPADLAGEELLHYPERNLRRCTNCILPETMPFISFDDEGVCKYCLSYECKNVQRSRDEIIELVAPYKEKFGPNVIVPFSGGRDSSFGLHVAVRELGLSPIAYTYDWGMVTDLGRRNISRMCSVLEVENIVVAANIARKRKYIRQNLQAWLVSPHLGMLSILTAGDKHFFRYIEKVKAETGISLNLWAINPLETTHFKSGFSGVPPNFAMSSVYSTGVASQVKYQNLRLQAMLKSKGYFNSSLWDTFTGEYFRSREKKTDYIQLFDFMRWDEKEVESTLETYGWEPAEDTRSTWRIGDGTAAFYNYVYGGVAGFTEHDTFRSNQIREGDLSRNRALELIEVENRPRYQNIRWYLEALDLDFHSVIRRVNEMPTVDGAELCIKQ